MRNLAHRIHRMVGACAVALMLTTCPMLLAGTSAEDEILDLMHRWKKAVNEPAEGELRAVLAPDFHATGPSGRFGDAEDWIAVKLKGPATPHCRLEDLEVRVLGEVAIVYGINSCHSTTDPNKPPAQSRFTNVVRRLGDRWLLSSYHVSSIPPPRRPVEIDASLLAEYEGTFVAPNGKESVFTAGNQRLTYAGSGTSLELFPLSPETFGPSEGTVLVTFVRDRTGRVYAAEFSRSGAVTRLRRK